MRCFILCCLVALAACRTKLDYASHLKLDKVYEYSYKGSVTVGARNELPVSALEFSSDIKITGSSDQKFFIQFFDPKFEELNGVKGRNHPVTLTNLMNRIAGEFAQPFSFDYNRGHVGHITAPGDVSDTVKNLVRGVLDCFVVTVKRTSPRYELDEGTIYGNCPSHYEKTVNETDIVMLRRVVDLPRCSEKAEISTGMASAVPNPLSKIEGLSHVTKVDYLFKLERKGTYHAIKEVKVKEDQSASPFNLKSGHFFLIAEKTLKLKRITEKYNDVDCGDMEYAGEIMYKFGDVYPNIPVVMQERDDPLERARRLLQKLAAEDKLHIAREANEDTLKLIQLYRVMSACDLNTLWKENKDNSTRAWLLSTITDTADMKLLNFIEDRFEASDLEPSEASQLVLVALNHIVVNREIVKKAQALLTFAFTKSNPNLWKSVVLSYGSLVYKLIAYERSYLQEDIQPLETIILEHLHVAHYDEEKVITAVKALGNTGSPKALKVLRKLLFSIFPGRVVTTQIQFSAIQAVRLMVDRSPRQMQEFTLDVFQKESLHDGLRMLAVKQLLESRPTYVMLRLLLALLRKEEPTEVDIFAYTYLRSFARSKTPENRYFSVYCKLMVFQLSRTYHRIASKYNDAIHLDWYSDDLLAGEAASYFIMNAMKGEIPDSIMISSTFLGISRILPLLEVGFDIEKIKELVKTVDPKSLLSILERLESIPDDKVIFSFYTQIFGQELFYIEVTREKIDAIKEDFRQFFMKGGSFSASQSVMVYEARYIQATCVGFPSEISKLYHSLTKLEMKAYPAISPLTTHKKIIMNTTGSLTLRKHLWTFFGVNTELFQCAAELKSKVSVYLPWDLSIHVEPDIKKLSVVVPIPMAVIHSFELSSEVSAITRIVGNEDIRTDIFPNLRNDQQCHTDCWSTGYGSSICVESGFGGTFHQFDDITSLFFGTRKFSVRIVPDRQNIGDKIRIAIIDRRGGEKVINSIETGVDIVPLFDHEDKKSNCSVVPLLNAEAVVMNGNKDVKGYKFGLYQMEGEPHLALQVTDFETGTPWMCLEGKLQSPMTRVDALARFGFNCSEYSMTLTSALHPAPGHLTAMGVILRWHSIPEYLSKLIQRIEMLAPGILYMRDYLVVDKINAMQQVAVHIVPTVHKMLEVLMEFPKFTAEKSFESAQPYYLGVMEQVSRNTTEIHI